MGALRPIFAFTNVAPVSPSFYVDAGNVLKQAVAFPCGLVNLDGYAAAAGWFQIFDTITSPTTGVTVPLKSVNVAGAGPVPSLFESLGPIPLKNGLFCAMSSTEAVYTAVATNFDVWGEIEEFEGVLESDTLTSSGDLTTGRDKLAVATDATAVKHLVQVDVINGTGAAAWLMLSALGFAPFNNGTRPSLAMPLLNVATAQTFKFGRDGLPVFSRTSAFVEKNLITAAVSTTGDTLTLKGDNSSKIRAYYKATA